MLNSTSVDTCLRLVPNVDFILQPYWMTIAACLFQVTLAAMFSRCDKADDQLQDFFDSSPELRFMYSPLSAIIIQQILSIAQFFTICGSITFSSTSLWTSYTTIYYLWINSSAPIVIFTSITSLYITWKVKENAIRSESQTVAARLLYLQLLIICPAFVTHILPATLLYSWLYLVILILYCGCCIFPRAFYNFAGSMNNIMVEDYKRKTTWSDLLIGMIGKTARSFIYLYLVQSYFNYAMMFYSNISSNGYIRVISQEFNARSTSCFVTALETSWQQQLSNLSFL